MTRSSSRHRPGRGRQRPGAVRVAAGAGAHAFGEPVATIVEFALGRRPRQVPQTGPLSPAEAEAVGRQFRRWRLRRGLSRATVAAQVGMTATQWGGVEGGEPQLIDLLTGSDLVRVGRLLGPHALGLLALRPDPR